jgi:hypothetical protein
MAEREMQVLFNGKMVAGIEIPISGSAEKWSEFELADGAIIRAKVNILSVVRVKDEHDAAGNPIYIINAAPVMGVVNLPKELARKE